MIFSHKNIFQIFFLSAKTFIATYISPPIIVFRYQIIPRRKKMYFMNNLLQAVKKLEKMCVD